MLTKAKVRVVWWKTWGVTSKVKNLKDLEGKRSDGSGDLLTVDMVDYLMQLNQNGMGI